MMEKKYEQYKLEWMVDHNHTIAEMLFFGLLCVGGLIF